MTESLQVLLDFSYNCHITIYLGINNGTKRIIDR